MSLLAIALVTSLAAQPAEAAKPAPMTVRVEMSDASRKDVADWQKALSAALEARKDEFRMAKPAEKADLVVRLDSVGRATDGTPSLNGALVRGDVTRPFNYGFTDVTLEADKLARNLRKLADQLKPAAK
jgi:hypothetical protein